MAFFDDSFLLINPFASDLSNFEEEFFDKFDSVVVSCCSLATKVWTSLFLCKTHVSCMLTFPFQLPFWIISFFWLRYWLHCTWSLFYVQFSTSTITLGLFGTCCLHLSQHLLSLLDYFTNLPCRKTLTTNVGRGQKELHFIQLIVEELVMKYLVIFKTMPMCRFFSSLPILHVLLLFLPTF